MARFGVLVQLLQVRVPDGVADLDRWRGGSPSIPRSPIAPQGLSAAELDLKLTNPVVIALY